MAKDDLKCFLTLPCRFPRRQRIYRPVLQYNRQKEELSLIYILRHWILNISDKALQVIGKIATGVNSHLLANWIKAYYSR
jgi:hypothetical protein